MSSEEQASYKHLDFEARCNLEKYLNAGMTLTWIAGKIRIPLSTLSREVKRNRRDDGRRAFTKTAQTGRDRGTEVGQAPVPLSHLFAYRHPAEYRNRR